MYKLSLQVLLVAVAVVVTGIYCWLLQPPQPPKQEIAGAFIVSYVLLGGIYYFGRWCSRRYARKPRSAPHKPP